MWYLFQIHSTNSVDSETNPKYRRCCKKTKLLQSEQKEFLYNWIKNNGKRQEKYLLIGYSIEKNKKRKFKPNYEIIFWDSQNELWSLI